MRRLDYLLAVPLAAISLVGSTVAIGPGVAQAGELAISSGGTSISPLSTSVTSSAVAPASVLSTIHDALQLRNSQLVTTSPTIKQPSGMAVSRLAATLYSAGYQSKASTERLGLQARKARLAVHAEVFSGTKSTVKIESFSQSGTTATAKILEHTDMTYRNYADGTTPPPSSYEYEQNVFLTKVNTAWVIDSVSPTSTYGIPPVTILGVASSAPATSSTPNSQAVLPAVPIASSSAQPGNMTFTNKDLSNPKSSSIPLASTGSLVAHPMSAASISAAEQYARIWAFGRNSGYINYADDCTNFVSQVMLVYGWGQAQGWYQSDSSWWTNSVMSSYPWVGAQHFANFAKGSGRIYYLSYLSSLGDVDVVQANWDPAHTNVVTHTMVVTYKNGNDIRLTYHTNDTLNRSIWDMYDAFPGTAWYALRT